jgi:hypothetical protein
MNIQGRKQSSPLLKKALKEIKKTKKENEESADLQEGHKGANSEAWNVQFGPSSPTLSCSPGF